MRDYMIEAPAKINLALEVKDKRADGYHNIETVFQEIDLKDKIYFSPSDSFELTCDNKLVPIGEDNIIYTAWELMKGYKEDGKTGVKIHLEKNIPIAAGLAGGSSNAASTLVGLNEYWELGLSILDLIEIGKTIGADVPYFIYGGTAFGSGRGDELKALTSFSKRKVLIVNNGYGVSTRYVYDNLELNGGRQIDFKPIIQAINEGRDDKLYPLLENRLEEVTCQLEPEVDNIKSEMVDLGAKASLMSGSGPTVFGFYEDDVALERSYMFFKDKYDLVFVSETI